MTANPPTNKPGTVAVELRLDRIAQLYNSLDPAPFHEKELDRAADEYIVGSAEDLGTLPMRLVVLLAESEYSSPQTRQIPETIRNHFLLRGQVERRRLRVEWQRGRTSLLIGLAFLIACLVGRGFLLPEDSMLRRILGEGLLIVGWVAMWGPIEIFLYGWWPIARRMRLYRRLAGLDVEVRALTGGSDRS